MLSVLTRLLPWNANVKSADGTADGPSRYVFVVTYGRSGSTLLQSLMNRLPGICIRGENNNVSAHMARAWASARLDEFPHLRNKSLKRPAHDPWHGAELIDAKRIGRDLARVLTDQVIAPPKGTEVAGFKEIRWHQDPEFFSTHLDFLRSFFPDAQFLINTRSHEAVSRSGWWRNMDPRVVQEKLESAEASFAEYEAAHPKICWRVHYDDYVRDPSAFEPVFKAVGRPFDLKACQDAMRKKLNHMK